MVMRTTRSAEMGFVPAMVQEVGAGGMLSGFEGSGRISIVMRYFQIHPRRQIYEAVSAIQLMG